MEDMRIPSQQATHSLLLNALASAMDQAHLPESRFGSRLEVGFHDGGDIARSKRVQIQRIFDGKHHRLRVIFWRLGHRSFTL